MKLIRMMNGLLKKKILSSLLMLLGLMKKNCSMLKQLGLCLSLHMIEVWKIDQLRLRLMLTHLRMQRKEKLVKVQEMIEEKARQQDAPLWMKIWSWKKLVE
ncbi:uncharacterized protein LOC114310776 [Camellia sinensis]|uniref:uncharacterized protein LOC114310776 n=1 Tax=Camellia sinensis TaxID=4442 RepID=UPI001036697C|nr:uncharacterized protein LOC114310776 [Camellia sinensis]